MLASKNQKIEDVGEEEQELDLEEESMRPRIADIIEHNYYFREVSTLLFILFFVFVFKCTNGLLLSSDNKLFSYFPSVVTASLNRNAMQYMWLLICWVLKNR